MLIKKFIRLISFAERRQGKWILFSSVIQALLNMIGLTVLIPIIILVFDPDKLAGYPSLDQHRNLILISIVCFIILKNVLNVWLANIQVRYINRLYTYYSRKLYENYYKQGLLFIKSRHSDELAYNTNAVSYLFTHGLIWLTLSIITEACLLLFIWSGICWFSPISAFCIALSFIPFSVLYFYWVRKKLKTYGEEEDIAKRSIMTIVGDTFKGYSDLELNNAYSWFRKKFDMNIAQIARSRKTIVTAVHIPQGIIECYVVIGMILFVVIAGNNNDAKISLGILSVAVLRILPSLRTLITMAVQWKNNAFTMDIINDINLPTEENNKLQHLNFQRQIKLDNVGFVYPEKEKFIFKNFSLNINKGECLGIQGMSGIGKTTLFNLILGFYKPQEGSILVDNISLNEENHSAWQKLIAYVPQDIFIMDASIAENIAFGVEKPDDKRLLQAIEKSGLMEYISCLTDGVHTIIGQNGNRLSGGQRQRVGIARALYKKAEIIFFDEATSSLDTKTEKDIMDTIYGLSKDIKNLTVVVVSHKQSVLSCCDRIVAIEKKKAPQVITL